MYMQRTHRDLSHSRPVAEHLLELAKEVFLEHMTGANTDGIDIRSGAMDSQSAAHQYDPNVTLRLCSPVRSRGVDSSTSLRRDLLREAAFDRHVVYKLGNKLREI